MRFNFILKTFYFSIILLFFIIPRAQAADKLIGAASVEISPVFPAAMDGQMKICIATATETPITANINFLKSRKRGRSLGRCILISCDVVNMPMEVHDRAWQEIKIRMLFDRVK